MKKINLSFLLIVLMVAAFLIGYGSKNGTSLGIFNQKAEEIAQQAVEYINQNFLAMSEEGATLVSVGEESGVYKFTILIEGQEYDSYITKDGKILFPDGVSMAIEETETEVVAETMTCEDLEKSNEPIMEVFVVSQCPFGTQMQRVLNEIIKNIPEIDNYIVVKYMGEIQDGKIIAMHGDEEAQENLKQICIREEQKDKYWNYIDCYLKEGQSEECLSSALIDKDMLVQCMEDASRGLEYAQKDFDSESEYGVTGSPTLILNKKNVSEFDFGGRTAEAVKTVICCGFNSPPAFCDKELTKDSADTGFSPVYSSESATGGNLSCD
jgi:glutaredoxin